MISGTDPTDDLLNRDRMVVVADRARQGALSDDLRGLYPDWNFTACDTFLSAIVEVSRAPTRAVLACVDPVVNRLGDAVAGLRDAAGPQARLVLCCTPESESVARQALVAGADDYVIHPLDRDEVDAAIGYARPAAVTGRTSPGVPGAFPEELAQLAAVLAKLGARPMALIEELAKLVRLGLDARGATVIVEGAVATSGDVVTKPVLSAPLSGVDGVIGQLTVLERSDGPYTPADTEKLNHYATIASRMLQAASKQREWRELALTDECSGLPNRRYLYARLDEILGRAAAERFPVTVLLFDVDDFKSYNDACGHDAGDEVIRQTGELFQAHCRDHDVVTRYGGDEFAVVFWDPAGPRAAGSKHPDCALAVLNRFNEALRTHRFPKLGPSADGQLTISGGLATYPWDGSTRDELLKKADQALLAAKRHGKNRIFLIGEAG